MNHPVTRIISFLILAFFLAQGKLEIMLTCSVLTLLLYLLDPPQNFTKLFRAILRMKWFFLSILLVYVLINNTSAHLSTQLFEGSKRILILIIMMSIVIWFLEKTPRDQIISGLIFLLSPLRLIGFPVERMALRIELIFRCIDDVQKVVIDKKENLKIEKKNIRNIGSSVAQIYKDIIEPAEKKVLDEIEIDLISKVSLRQWMLPIFLFSFLCLIQKLS